MKVFSKIISVASLSLLVASIGCATSPAHEYHAREIQDPGRLGLLDRLNQDDTYYRAGKIPPSARTAHEVAARDLRESSIGGTGSLHSMSLRWPLKNIQVTSYFGRRGSAFHEGIDLRAAQGTPVYAAQAGIVLYAGEKIRGYGKMVVLKHGHGVATIYAHNYNLLVKKGQSIQQGQKIAVSGNTGHSTGPHLHFEIRDGLSAIDPLRVLPRLQIVPNRVPARGRREAKLERDNKG